MINLKEEQKASLSRKRYGYTAPAKLLFCGMDLLAGKKHSLPKAKLLEILASVPYREWEIKEYFLMTRKFRNRADVEKAGTILKWSREAQDNEYMHLLVIHEKMKEDTVDDPWYLSSVMLFSIVWGYVIFAKIMKYVSLKTAFHFNAQFEDHAEHVYAEMVEQHPEWENQPVANAVVKEYADVSSWADIFRTIGLDERNHRNASFRLCQKDEFVV